MFKLKVPKKQRDKIQSVLNVTDSIDYDYVVTTDKDLVEDDKINIVFPIEETAKVSKILDVIAKGEDVYITGYDEIGQKNIEARFIQYFMIEADDVFAVLSKSRYLVKMKLYELEELLKEKYFVRVSKYALVNINRIEYIKPALNSKLTLQMKNGEEVEVNRHYYKSFKQTLNL